VMAARVSAALARASTAAFCWPVQVRYASAAEAGPLGHVPSHRAVHVVGSVVQRPSHVVPGLCMCLDLGRVTGEPVECLAQRLDVLDDPGDAVLEERTDGVGDEGQRVEAGRHRAERALDPAAVLHPTVDGLDVLGDPHPSPRIDRRTRRGDQRVPATHRVFLRRSAALPSAAS